MLNCEIILIGNELLIGKIQDKNGKWMIEQLLPYGVEVTRITIIKDNLDVISSTINHSISRSPDYIFTSGGLGPTYDDMTFEGTAKGLNPPVPMILNEEALAMLKERYRNIYPNVAEEKLMKPSRKKMAILPKGAIPLENPEGSAPGILIPSPMTNGKTKIICMPGIPTELKSIFLKHILPEIIEQQKGTHFYQCGFVFEYIGESKFTEVIKNLVDEHKFPDIWIKTHPKKKKNKTVELHLTSFSENNSVREKMNKLYKLLKDQVFKQNGKIIKENPLE